MRTLAILLLMASAVMAEPIELRDNAEGPSTAQLLKVFGHLQEVPLKQIPTLAVSAPAIQNQKDIAFDVNKRLCLNPDKPDREIAASDAKTLATAVGYSEEVCQDLINMHAQLLKRWQQARAPPAAGRGGSGSWPLNCYPEDWEGWHSRKVYVDFSGFNSSYTASVTAEDIDALDLFLANRGGDAPWHSVAKAKELFVGMPAHKFCWDELIPEASRRHGCAMIRVDDFNLSNVEVKSIPIAGSVIGYAYFNNGKCGDRVRLRLDSTWRPNRHRHWLLAYHELLHTCNGQHTFTGQNTHRGVLSYAWKEPFVGLSNGQSNGYDRPKDPAWTQMVRHYGTEVPPRKGDPITPDPPVNPPKPGTKVTITIGDKTYYATLDSSGPDEGPTLTEKVAKALAAVEEYPNKEADRKALGQLYANFGKAVVDGAMTVDQAQKTIGLLRGFFVRKADNWAGVYELADAVKTAEGLVAVSKGLGYSASEEDQLTWAEAGPMFSHARIVLAGMAAEEFNKELIEIIIQVIDQYFPDGPFKSLIKIFLPIIIGLIDNAEEADEPAPAQKIGGIRIGPVHEPQAFTVAL